MCDAESSITDRKKGLLLSNNSRKDARPAEPCLFGIYGVGMRDFSVVFFCRFLVDRCGETLKLSGSG